MAFVDPAASPAAPAQVAAPPLREAQGQQTAPIAAEGRGRETPAPADPPPAQRSLSGSLTSRPSAVTGTAAGLAGAAAVLIDTALVQWTGHPVSSAFNGAEITIYAYLLGVWLHVPTS